MLVLSTRYQKNALKEIYLPSNFYPILIPYFSHSYHGMQYRNIKTISRCLLMPAFSIYNTRLCINNILSNGRNSSCYKVNRITTFAIHSTPLHSTPLQSSSSCLKTISFVWKVPLLATTIIQSKSIACLLEVEVDLLLIRETSIHIH
jgi:hypothetical protein